MPHRKAGLGLATAADRQSNLAELCGVWSGVIAAAVYIPLLGGQLVPEAGLQPGNTVPDVIARLAAFHKLMDTQGAASLLSSRASLTAASWHSQRCCEMCTRKISHQQLCA